MGIPIKRVAVLGAGVMGQGIAAHLANAGIPSYLFDIAPGELTPAEEKKGLALDDKVVGVVAEAVDQGLSVQRVGEHGQPLRWRSGALMFGGWER